MAAAARVEDDQTAVSVKLSSLVLQLVQAPVPRFVIDITDRPDWHRAIFDQQVTAQWREDAVASSSLINDKTWECDHTSHLPLWRIDRGRVTH
jgi:hypothetical protein